MVPEQLGFKVLADVLLADGADLRLLGRETFIVWPNERRSDFAFMVDEPLNDASSRWKSGAWAALTVAQGPHVAPIVSVVRV